METAVARAPSTHEQLEAAAWSDLVAACPEALRRRLHLRSARIGSVLVVRASMIPDAAFNRALCFDPTDPLPPGLLDDVIAAAGDGPPLELQLPGALAADAEDDLRRRGFTLSGRMALLQRPTAPPPPVGTDFTVGPTEDGPAFGAAYAEGWDAPPIMGELLAGVVGRRGWTAHAVRDGDRIVSTGLGYRVGDDEWFGFASTVTDARTRGGQTVLVCSGLARQQGLGIVRTFTEAVIPPGGERNRSLDNLQRLGFEVVAVRTCWRTSG